MSGSLAILTDAAHLMSDVAGFGISMFSIWLGTKKPNQRSSYGYHRAEVIGAIISIFIIWIMVAWLFYKATLRIMYQVGHDIDAPIMLGVSFISLACNLFNLAILGHFSCCGISGDKELEALENHDNEKRDNKNVGGNHQSTLSEKFSGEEGENINVRAAIVHIIGDLLQSVGVIIAASMIYYDEKYKIVDPICTYLFSIVVMCTTIPVFNSCMNVFME